MNMKTWGRNLLLLALLTPAVNVHAAAPLAKPIHVTVDGKVLQFDVAPVKLNDRVLVPLRTITEAVGSTVGWNAQTQTVTVTRNSDSVALTLGKNTATKNDASVTLDVPAQMINDRTMVPVRFLSEGLGLQVAWDEPTSTVIVKDGEKQAFTVKEIFKNNKDRVALVKVFDKDGEELGTGSGFMISTDGKFLTNYHVIEGAAKAEIIFHDKTYTTEQLLLGDAVRDLALLKIDATNLPHVQLGDSGALEIGDSVVAIGSPIGFQNTLSAGLVSGLNRNFMDMGIPEKELAKMTPEEKAMLEQEFIQTNAPITHGSSGGALFNMNGEVVGVTSNGFSFIGGEVNFAIPGKDVKKFLEQTPTPKKLSEIVSSKTDPGEDEDDEDFEEDFWTMYEVEDKLNEEYATYEVADSKDKIELEYSVYPSEDRKSYDIELYIEGTYFLKDGKADASKILPFLKKVMKDVHAAESKNPLVTVEIFYETDKVDPELKGKAEFYPRTGKYHVVQEIAWALLDDKTQEVKYSIAGSETKTFKNE